LLTGRQSQLTRATANGNEEAEPEPEKGVALSKQVSCAQAGSGLHLLSAGKADQDIQGI
jgi:hypothetical protein